MKDKRFGPVHFPERLSSSWHPGMCHYHTNIQMLLLSAHVVRVVYSACKLSHWATWRKPLTWQGALSQRWSGVSSEHPESPAHISGGFKSTWLLLREMWIKEVGGCRRNTFLKQTGVKVQPIGPWAQDIFCFRTNSELSWFFRSSGPRLQCSLV